MESKVKVRTEPKVWVKILVKVPVVVIYTISLFREVRIFLSKLRSYCEELLCFYFEFLQIKLGSLTKLELLLRDWEKLDREWASVHSE